MQKVILLTNDDGYFSHGIRALKEALSPLGRVVVVAPATEKSACGHGLNITKPLRLIEVEKDFYKLDDGSPTDCIYMALATLFKDKKPDLVVSGINLGSNVGEDVTYSGTVAGAIEGALHGVPSIAISQYIQDKDLNAESLPLDLSVGQNFIHKLVEKIFKEGYMLETRRVLNINIPHASVYNGASKVTQLGYRHYQLSYEENINPRNVKYYWLGNMRLVLSEREDGRGLESDYKAIKEGFISLTPLSLDLTSYEDIQKIKDLNL
ncbi:5'/3'-nucleotidase SurE [Helicobacter sp. 13S00401-1]|uniref:5'/3'-nucleotidase SurE n=1 Tax=Helicobacter sp. 13S00401-1 TaxID=1905758 RepID=UPI000BA5B89F|nr:5'/3'-nucleotidase SurE [Helicobacter sp. 13S00401-1]PAF50956.1 5'/3'-nucleotidase SurE [Helicobacter sp. 13S00401-1]